MTQRPDWNKLIYAIQDEAAKQGLERSDAVGVFVTLGGLVTDIAVTTEKELQMNYGDLDSDGQTEIARRIAHSKIEDCMYSMTKRTAEYAKGAACDPTAD